MASLPSMPAAGRAGALRARGRGLGRLRGWSGERWAIAQFALSGLAAVALVLVLVLVAFNRAGRDAAISSAVEVTRVSTTGVIGPLLGADVLRGDATALAALDRRVRASLLDEPVLRITVYRPDGSVVYSSDASLRRSALDSGMRAAFATGRPQTRTGDAQAPGADIPPGTQLLDVYQPATAATGERLLVHSCRTLASVTTDTRSMFASFGPWLIAGLLGLQLLNLPLAVALVRRVRRARRHDEALLQREVDASDRERRRLAGDLHNGVIQEIAGMSMALTAAQRAASVRGDAAGAGQLAEIAASGRRTTRTLRHMLVDIYPPNLQRAGLRAALEDLGETARERGLAVSLSIDGKVDALPPDRSATVYRVVQEAIRNAIRHARATRLDLGVARGSDGGLRVRVSDDGRGFGATDGAAPTGTDGHLGLALMRDLVEESGGELSIESTVGAGTTVRVRIPNG